MPPERYIVTFKCKSIAGLDAAGNPKYASHHQVEIYLHNQYPQRWPGMKWLTPIWHPNINHLNGSVCIDAAWWTASRSLDRLVDEHQGLRGLLDLEKGLPRLIEQREQCVRFGGTARFEMRERAPVQRVEPSRRRPDRVEGDDASHALRILGRGE